MRQLAALSVLCSLLTSAAFAGDLAVALHDDKNQPVPDAVVSLKPLDAPVPPVSPTAAPAVVAQQGLEFTPYVTPVQVGTHVIFPDRDTVQHQVYSLSKAKRFEIPLYNGEAKVAILFDRTGVVTLGCNVHDWMIAYIVVLPTPYFAKTGVAGTAKVTGVPPGRYQLEIWHPRLTPVLTREVTITGGEASPLDFTVALKPDHRIRRAPDATGGGYK
jgi:plastocyanin